jgi:hypothetical protein
LLIAIFSECRSKSANFLKGSITAIGQQWIFLLHSFDRQLVKKLMFAQLIGWVLL